MIPGTSGVFLPSSMAGSQTVSRAADTMEKKARVAMRLERDALQGCVLEKLSQKSCRGRRDGVGVGGWVGGWVGWVGTSETHNMITRQNNR